MIGHSIARYRITALLGSGGMGEVYQATDTRLGRRVALKLLPDAVAHDPERTARLTREAKTLASEGLYEFSGRVTFDQRARQDLMLHCSRTSTRIDMALNIRSAEAERLAAELARQTGETKTEAVTKALRDRLTRVRRERSRRRLADELEAIAEHCANLPVLDTRSADAILGYDDHGLPR
jgi:antitoxin VapB